MPWVVTKPSALRVFSGWKRLHAAGCIDAILDAFWEVCEHLVDSLVVLHHEHVVELLEEAHSA